MIQATGESYLGRDEDEEEEEELVALAVEGVEGDHPLDLEPARTGGTLLVSEGITLCL